MMAGVAINPHTPVSALLEDVIGDIDLVNMMSVNPGFGGQKFIPNTYNKIRQLRQFAQKHNVRIFIEVDGGVDVENAGELVTAGANVLVAGNSVFSFTKSETNHLTTEASCHCILPSHNIRFFVFMLRAAFFTFIFVPFHFHSAQNATSVRQCAR